MRKKEKDFLMPLPVLGKPQTASAFHSNNKQQDDGFKIEAFPNIKHITINPQRTALQLITKSSFRLLFKDNMTETKFDSQPRPELEKQPHESKEMNEDTTTNSIDTKEEWEQQRDMHKAEADKAYSTGDMKKSIQEYTNAITFDPEWHVLYSNRSAAHLRNGEKSKALADAKKCVEIKPDFVKGHSRLASAMYSLGRYNEARGVYKYILGKLDENHKASKDGLEDCRVMEQSMKQREMEILRHAQNQAKQSKEEAQNEKDETENEKAKEKGGDDGDEDDDLLNDFFDEVEEVQVKKKIIPQKEEELTEIKTDEKKENKIQIQLTDLGDAKTQIQRLLCSNHEWYNLNPFRVLDISHKAPLEILSRRYKALSLLLHPDKVRTSNSDSDTIEKAGVAFEYVRKAINTLKDEDKLRHTVDLIEQGRKKGKKDFEAAQKMNTTNGKDLENHQDIATMKIFAEVEQKRRDVERRKRKFEERERDQEDEEANKIKKEHTFEKKWKEEGRVEKRINNWRNFKGAKR